MVRNADANNIDILASLREVEGFGACMEKTALIFCYLEVSSDLDVRYTFAGTACQVYLCKLISINTQCANVIQKEN